MVFLDLISISFPKLENFSPIIFWISFMSLSLSLSFPSIIISSNIHIDLVDGAPSVILNIFISFLPFIGLIPLSFFFISLPILSSTRFNLILNPSTEFFSLVIGFFSFMIYFLLFLIFSISLFKFLLRLCIVLISVIIIMSIILNSLSFMKVCFWVCHIILYVIYSCFFIFLDLLLVHQMKEPTSSSLESDLM